VNEAIEIAKKYSTEESGKFVNGILGSYLRSEGTATTEVIGG
jgi:N utilization substance protein B